MTDALGSTVPAGWYPDPWGSASQRWWDGMSWSARLDTASEAQATDAPGLASVPAGTRAAGEDGDYVPAAVRSTFEPASSYRTAPAPTVGSPLPSRRALRELAQSVPAEDAAVETEEPLVAELNSHRAPIAEGQIPGFTPATGSALPPPVWTDPDEDIQPVRLTAPAEPVAAPPATESAAQAASPAASFQARPATDDDWAASLAGWDDVESASTPPDARPIFGDAPPVSYSQRAIRYQPLHGRTSPVWLIVFMPVLHAVAVVGSVFLYPELLQDQQLSALEPAAAMAVLLSMRDWLLFAVIPLGVAFFIFTFIMGFQDRARLRLLGHDQTASPWWILLSPLVYLIVRSIRVSQSTGRRGSGPLTTYICLYIAPAIAIVVASVVANAVSGAIPS